MQLCWLPSAGAAPASTASRALLESALRLTADAGAMSAAASESCELCIIGAGYAAVNALNAASKYLSTGARVVVVDRGARWGGQWCEQYDYVRLHQPYEQFTAGERTWAIGGQNYRR